VGDKNLAGDGSASWGRRKILKIGVRGANCCDKPSRELTLVRSRENTTVGISAALTGNGRGLSRHLCFEETVDCTVDSGKDFVLAQTLEKSAAAEKVVNLI
jgi:hypothetical protein